MGWAHAGGIGLGSGVGVDVGSGLGVSDGVVAEGTTLGEGEPLAPPSPVHAGAASAIARQRRRRIGVDATRLRGPSMVAGAHRREAPETI
jgi:hypothetical protein